MSGARGLTLTLGAGLAVAGCSGATAPRHATVKSPTSHAASRAAAAVRAPAAPRDRWTVLPPSRLTRTEVASARIGSSVYVLGGFDQATGRTTTAVERFDLV
ncbi:MAG: Kelch motif, partial [Solirubrobacteraceae bacterium]|nr:Kelch motif [Solirubrobacteraceae bacterium]